MNLRVTSAIYKFTFSQHKPSTATLIGCNANIVLDSNSKSFTVNLISDFKSIRLFLTQSLSSENLTNIDSKLFHHVRESNIKLRSLPNSSLTYFCNMASFFVGDLRNNFITFRIFETRGAKSVYRI